MATNNILNHQSSPFTVTNNITVTTGNIITSAGSITSATSLTATSGAITATAGNVVITSGNLTLPTTSSTVGQILVNSILWAHSFGTGDVFIGATAGNTALNVYYSQRNVGIGYHALIALEGAVFTEGSDNVVCGYIAGETLTTGQKNCFIGRASGNGCTIASGNVAIAFNSAQGSLDTGLGNVIFGSSSGASYSSDESYNILLGADITGTAGEDNVLRIGKATGTTASYINQAIICGIYGGVYTSGAAVKCNSSNVLGTTSSNQDSKQDIADMGDDSSVLYGLKASTFKFKDDTNPKPKQYGMIAEDVEPVFPGMVLYDQEGKPWNLAYHYLPPMLVNEFQKLNNRIKDLEAQVALNGL